MSVYDNFARFYSYSLWVGFTAELSEAILIFTLEGASHRCPGVLATWFTSPEHPHGKRNYLMVLQDSVFFEFFICFFFSFSQFSFIEKINKYEDNRKDKHRETK